MRHGEVTAMLGNGPYETVTVPWMRLDLLVHEL